jgi:hypothetical protein
MSQMKFNEVLIYSDKSEYWNNLPVKKINKIESLGEYNRLITTELPKHLNTDYCLIIQFDGFVLNSSEWNNLFLHYDYIGAPWPVHNHGKHNVGNGGFSLRSKKLCNLISSFTYDDYDKFPEDLHICQRLRPELESKHGIHFPSESIASHFSSESYVYRYPTFGFHNIRFLPLVYSSRLDFMLDNLSDRVVKTHGNLIMMNLKNISASHAKKLKERMESS